MRKVREVARLKASGLTTRQIADCCRLPRSTVSDYLIRLSVSGYALPLPADLGENELQQRLFPGCRGRKRDEARPLPDWGQVHRDLRRKGVTLRLLWKEYRTDHDDGYGYTQFCEHYRSWAKTVHVSMRQTHRAGEKLFVDYAGMTMPVRDPSTGETKAAEIFVSAMGASQYLYAEATRSQQLRDWVGSHVRAFEYLGGVPTVVVPDNLKSAVSKACRYDPDLNPTYADLAAYYGVAVIPARPRKPKDKAKVESGVQIVEREILAPLRDQTFFSLGELNRAISERLKAVNSRAFQKLDVSRADLFNELDRPELKPLPPERYQYGEFLRPRVNIDYHVEVKGHYYSVPYRLRGQQLDVRLSGVVEVFHRGKRVASHARDDRKGRHTTEPTHMPKAHQEHLEWTPSRIIARAGKIGPCCAEVTETIIRSRPHPEQGYRSCMGITRLAKRYGDVRLEAACRRARAFNVCTYGSIKSILETGKDSEELPGDGATLMTCRRNHHNVRGSDYYRDQENESQPQEKTDA